MPQHFGRDQAMISIAKIEQDRNKIRPRYDQDRMTEAWKDLKLSLKLIFEKNLNFRNSHFRHRSKRYNKIEQDRTKMRPRYNQDRVVSDPNKHNETSK